MKKLLFLLMFPVLCFVGLFACNSHEYGEMIDERDGKTYKTVQIGNQIWMAENLAIEPSIKWNNLKKRCRIYDNEEENIAKYGFLYHWKTACKVCPEGWHLPSDEEWLTMVEELGSDDLLSKKLKSKSGWKGSMNGNNESGFNAFPGGTYIDNLLSKKVNMYYFWVGEYTSYHSSTESANQSGEKFNSIFEIQGFDFNKRDRINIRPSDSSRNYSYVRCIKDNDVENKVNTKVGYTAIPDQKFEQVLFDLGYDDVIDGKVLTVNINTVDSLGLKDKNISDLTGIEAFSALTYLNCWRNQLTSLDVSNNTALTYLDCHLNQLTNLDVSNNTALTRLYCSVNQLTSLDVSNNTSLTYLSCYLNKLTSLDVSSNTALTDLNCGTNQLTNLDVSNNTALTYLVCDYNKFDCDALKANYGL